MKRGVKTKELCVHEGGQFGEGKIEKRKRERKRKRYRLLKISQISHISKWMNRKETSRVINALEKSCWDMARPGSQQKKGAFKVID